MASTMRTAVKRSEPTKVPITIALPFSVGMWATTQPVQIPLVKGKNVFRFYREGEVKGVTIKDFTLTPVK